MKLNTPYTPTVVDMLEIETEDARAMQDNLHIARTLEESGITKVERLLEGANWRRVVQLTGEKLGEMEQHEIRALYEWMEHRAELLARQMRLARRHLLTAPELPAALRVRGVL